MRRADFAYELPPELIAQRPAAERTGSRLLVLEAGGTCADRRFTDLPELLTPHDLLVFNDTRVIPARLTGRKTSGGQVELLLERILTGRLLLAQLRASKALKTGGEIELPGGARARYVDRHDDLFVLELDRDPLAYFEMHGQVPLPPYITHDPEAADRERYQTVYAREPGAVAAPTAGLHFDETMLARLRGQGVRTAFVTLHVGAGTFQTVRVDDLAQHRMHGERVEVSADTCAAITETRQRGGRVIAVGTTVVRSLESAAAAMSGAEAGNIAPFVGETQLFIRPGYAFQVVDALLTNFHLPESTLLMLVCAFNRVDAVLAAYAHAVRERYRFFSYGDAMFVERAE